MIRNLFILSFLIFSAAALAQPADGQFIHTPTTTPGCNGLVTSSAKLANGDVIFGGTFTRCGAVRANRVVRFDGSQFFPLGIATENGVNGAVRAVVVDGSKIYVGGRFSAAGSTLANNVAMFDAGVWRSIGRGASNGVAGVVRSLQVYQSKLYVGGYEVLSPSTWAPRLREWNGGGWRDLVSFQSEQSVQGSVNAFEVRNSQLYFGGTFKPVGLTAYRFLGSYDGTAIIYDDSFLPLGFPGFQRVRDLHWFLGRLCVAGSFNLLPNSTSGVACKSTSGWQSFGLYSMRALADDGTVLYAAGTELSNQGSVYALGSITFTRQERTENDFILTLVFQGEPLLVGGALAQKLTPAFGLLRLIGGQFQPLISGDAPVQFGGLAQLIAANATLFTSSAYSGLPHPLLSTQIAQRVDGQWQNIPNPPLIASVEDGVTFSMNSVLHFSPYNSSSVYAWTGSQWNTISDTFFANATYGNSIIRIEGPDVNGNWSIFRFGPGGSQLWLQIPPLKRNGQIIHRDRSFPLSLVEFQGRPVIAGQFDEMVGVGAIGSVATFYDGAWHALGAQGLTDPKWPQDEYAIDVRLLSLGNELYASNGFTQADGQPVDGIARFDGNSWRPLGEGIVQSDNIAARADVKMINYQNSIYAYGVFDRAGGQVAHNIAQWDGARWRTLGVAGAEGLFLDGNLQAAVVNGELHLSGEIHEAGAEPADFYAIWRGNDRIFASGFE
jgi:trimeric autotransporter adhesin